MKWTFIKNHREGMQELHLVDNGQALMVLKYNPHQHSARIICHHQQRLFFIKASKQTGGKFTFTNEYGMAIGQLLYDRGTGNKGSLQLDNNKYFFELTQTQEPQLSIYKAGTLQPLVTCGLPKMNEMGTSSFSNILAGYNYNSVLIALSWYLILPISLQQPAGIAMA